MVCSSLWRHVKKEQLRKMNLKWGVTGVPSPPSSFPFLTLQWKPGLQHCTLWTHVHSGWLKKCLLPGCGSLSESLCLSQATHFPCWQPYSAAFEFLLAWVNVLLMAKAECSTAKWGYLIYCDSPKKSANCLVACSFLTPFLTPLASHKIIPQISPEWPLQIFA